MIGASGHRQARRGKFSPAGKLFRIVGPADCGFKVPPIGMVAESGHLTMSSDASLPEVEANWDGNLVLAKGQEMIRAGGARLAGPPAQMVF